MQPDRIPVIIGFAEVLDRPADPAQGREPAQLMADALDIAAQETGVPLSTELDTLFVINQMSWRYANLPAAVSERVRASPRHVVYAPIGGETPVRLLNDAALRIASGKSEMVAIVGGEAQYSVDKARAAKVALPWTAPAPKEDMSHLVDFIHPVALRHLRFGGLIPAQIYPFYETAATAAWGQTAGEARASSGLLWEQFAKVAASNPTSWSKTSWTADQIATPDPQNRLIAWPYTKRMVANPSVNQAAAILVTSLSRARAAGISENLLIYIWGGAAASECRDYLARDQYIRSAAQEVVLESAASIAGEAGFEALELYSCFPIVPKMTQIIPGIGDNLPPTVTGGLSFFGAPINSYMAHAICAMSRTLREGAGGLGLLYGQGEYVTKHHALVLSRRPAPPGLLERGYDRQAEANERIGPAPQILDDFSGTARIEAFTIVYDRQNEPEFATIIGRTRDEARIMARVQASDEAAMDCLTDLDSTPVGMIGQVRPGSDGLLNWHF